MRFAVDWLKLCLMPTWDGLIDVVNVDCRLLSMLVVRIVLTSSVGRPREKIVFALLTAEEGPLSEIAAAFVVVAIIASLAFIGKSLS